MAIKSDRWIKRMALEHGMIEPFVEWQVREGVVSYGLSSYGYDIRVADEFKVFTNINHTVIDPKHFDPRSFVDIKADVCIVPPNSFALARTIEYFRIPRDVLTICLGKSTYARCGIIVNVTPFEPEWEGTVTLEISNTTPLPATHLRQRGDRPGAVLPERRAVRGVVRRQAREVPEAAGRHAAEGVDSPSHEVQRPGGTHRTCRGREAALAFNQAREFADDHHRRFGLGVEFLAGGRTLLRGGRRRLRDLLHLRDRLRHFADPL